MKKHLLVLGMIICMLGLTACGSSKADDTSYLSTEDALSCAEYYFDGLSQMSSEKKQKSRAMMFLFSRVHIPVMKAASMKSVW